MDISAYLNFAALWLALRRSRVGAVFQEGVLYGMSSSHSEAVCLRRRGVMWFDFGSVVRVRLNVVVCAGGYTPSIDVKFGRISISYLRCVCRVGEGMCMGDDEPPHGPREIPRQHDPVYAFNDRCPRSC